MWNQRTFFKDQKQIKCVGTQENDGIRTLVRLHSGITKILIHAGEKCSISAHIYVAEIQTPALEEL